MSDELMKPNDTQERFEAVREDVRRSITEALSKNGGGPLTDEQTADIRMKVFRDIYGGRSHTGVAKNGEVYEVPDFRGISVDDMIVEDPAPFGETHKTVRFSLTVEPRADTIYGGLPEELSGNVQKGDRVITVGLAPYVLARPIGSEFQSTWLFAEKVPNPPTNQEQ